MGSRARILLADDHEGMLNNASTLLQTQFEVVGQVGDGRAAVNAAFVLKPDLVVLDIMMPEMKTVQDDPFNLSQKKYATLNALT